GFNGRIGSDGHFKNRYEMNGMGDIWSDIANNLFGEEGAQQVSQSIQEAGTNYVINQLGQKVAVDPKAQEAIASAASKAGEAGFAAIWEKYKWPITIVSSIAGIFIILGAYNMVKRK